MRLDKLIYDIREGVRQFTDDTEVTDRYITHLINTHRADYIRRELNNLQRVTTGTVTQTLCIELIPVSAYQCRDVDCKIIMRSKVQIPDTIDLHLGSAIVDIRPIDRTLKPFKFTSKKRAVFALEGPYANKTITAYLDDDNYIYVLSKNELHKFINCISITGVFVDPTELSQFNNCCDCEDSKPCFNELESDYPIPSHLIKSIRDEIVQKLVGSLQIPKDEINDAND